jgi:lysophospholipase L1-like esterase
VSRTDSAGTFDLASPRPHAYANFSDALAKVSTRPVNIIVLGDSVSEGTGASHLAFRWVDLLRKRLREDYPVADVYPSSRGFIPACYIFVAQDYLEPTLAGGAIEEPAWVYGIGGRSVRLRNSGDSLTYASGAVIGKAIEVYYRRPRFFCGGVDVTIDGDLVDSFSTFSPVTPSHHRVGGTFDRPPWPHPEFEDFGMVRYDGLADDGHTVKVSYNASFHGEGNDVHILGVRAFQGAEEGRGIHMWDGSHGGFAAQSHLDLTLEPMLMSKADLVILCLGYNDGWTPAATFRTRMIALIDKCRAERPNVPIVFVGQVKVADGVEDDWDFDWSTKQAEFDDIVAARSGVSFIDLAPLMSDFNSSTVSDDGLHPNDGGHEQMARHIGNHVSQVPEFNQHSAGLTDSVRVVPSTLVTYQKRLRVG